MLHNSLKVHHSKNSVIAIVRTDDANSMFSLAHCAVYVCAKGRSTLLRIHRLPYLTFYINDLFFSFCCNFVGCVHAR